mgnify:CR=1 FL=1
MNQNLKKIIAIVAGLILVFVAYFGSYLPLQKSHLFIKTMRNLSQINSLQEFEEAMSTVLEFNSPIGQEELLRQFASTIIDVINQPHHPPVLGKLINTYLNKYYEPIIQSGSGMSFNQNLYVLGTLNEIAALKTQNPEFLSAAKTYYLKSYEIGPKRPQALFGLFDIYRIEGNVEEVKKIHEQILTQWPGEKKTKQAFEEFLSKVSSSNQ